MDVMISYSHEDTPLMRAVKAALKEVGLTVWVDEDGLNAGVDFLSKIGQAVVECHSFLSIVTSASIKSKYCKDEVNLAYVSKRPIFAFSLESKSECFTEMNFGQKLIFSGVRFTTVGHNATDDRLAERAKALSFDIKDLLQKLNLFVTADQVSSTSDASQRKDKWRTLEKFRRQNTIEDDGAREVVFDVTVDTFWELNFGNKEEKVDWDVFEHKFKSKFRNQLEKFCTADKDADWFMQVVKEELADKNSDPSVLYKERLFEFCSAGKQRYTKELLDELDQRLWFSVSSYIAEYTAISEVFSLQSTVRLDAINKLKEYNSRAAEETLMDLTRDRDPNVRATAAVTLAKVIDEGNQRAADRLAALLKDRDRLVRESACVALGRLKSAEKVNDLVSVWRNDVISTVRAAAQLALEHIDSPEAKEAIHITKILADELQLLTTS